MNAQPPVDELHKQELQKRILKLGLNELQYQVFHSPVRFRVLVAGRRFGKTELALAEILKVALTSPNRHIWYVFPVQKQGKQMVWPRLKTITRKLQARKPSETERYIELVNGSSIQVMGALKPDSLRGDGLDLVILDEVADLKPEAWNEVLRPSLADRLGRALFIGTPKGRNHLYDYFELAKSHPDWQSFQFTTAQGGLVQKSELESAGRTMGVAAFRREMEAEFNTIGEYRAYLGFNREWNIRETHYEPALPLIWSLDFNVDPMCMLVMQRNGDVVNVLKEIVVRSNATTTEAACRTFIDEIAAYTKTRAYTYGALEVHAYGDASGHQRRTSAADTDWTLIRNFFRTYHNGAIELRCLFAKINPRVRDRVNCVNARLRNAANESHLFISPGCKELIRDLEEVCYTTDSVGAVTSDLNKSDKNRTHMSDALGYFISQAFPLRGTFQL